MRLYSATSRRPHHWSIWLVVWCMFALGVVPPVLLATILSASVIQGHSMAPTLVGPGVGVYTQISEHSPLQRGAIVSFPVADGRQVKRIIGLPGERITIAYGFVFVQKVGVAVSARLVEPYITDFPDQFTFPQPNKWDFRPTSFDVPANHYFVLADYREVGSDSRTYQQDKRLPTPFVPRSIVDGRLRLYVSLEMLRMFGEPPTYQFGSAQLWQNATASEFN